MADRLRRIARVIKTRGRGGEVVAHAACGLPPLLREGLRVAAVPPTLGQDRWHVVERASGSAQGQLVLLSGVGSLGEAQALCGRWLLAAVSELPRDLALRDERALTGREVQDARLGYVGRIEGVLRGPAHDLWQVRGERGETLIPAVSAIVGTELIAEGPIRVELPRGLVAWDGGE